MTKVIIGHEDLFNLQETETDNRPEKDHFDFNYKWVDNFSDTERITVRKRKTPIQLI
jgi:hypothetical protein